MPAYIVTYDLIAPRKDYNSLYAAIKTYGTHWHMLESNWIVVTDDSASEIWHNLSQHLDDNDKLFIARMTNDAAWSGLSAKGSEWLKVYLR
jgi:hypothetical protein